MEMWQKQMQLIIDEIDANIRDHRDEALTLSEVAGKLGYSEYYFSRKFREVSGMQFRDYLRYRKLAFALKAVRDTEKNLLDIALDYGFSSHEAFSRAFREAYGISPSEYRKNPVPVALRTVIKPFDCYLMEQGIVGREVAQGDVKTYFVSIPAHKFLHIKNYVSIGYWDFWQKMGQTPGLDCETVCGLLASIPGKLDDLGGNDIDSGSGQIMGFLNHPAGRICSWGIPLAECYGVRLPLDFVGEIPPQMELMEVPEGEYIVFEHGPFDYETQNGTVERKIEETMRNFDYTKSGYELDLTPGRIFYFFHDCQRYWKYIRPVKKSTV